MTELPKNPKLNVSILRGFVQILAYARLKAHTLYTLKMKNNVIVGPSVPLENSSQIRDYS